MHRSIFAVRLLAYLSAAAFVPLALLMALAPHYEWAWHARARVVAAVFRPVKFPGFASDRDGQCSLADAWRESVPERAIIARQIAMRLRVLRAEGPFEQVATPAGNLWIPAGDTLALAEEFAEQGEDEYESAQTGIRPGDTVLDCGANVGVFTREALRHGAGRVIAIEPNPVAVECLRRNFSDEIETGRVVVYPKGVWDREDTLQLNVPPGMASTAATVALQSPAGLTVPVPLTTIDRLVADLHLERVDFIKMDIEGAEPNALRGAVSAVRRFHPRMAISLEHRKTDPETLPALARSLWPGYRIERGPCTNMKEHLQPVVMYARLAPAAGSR